MNYKFPVDKDIHSSNQKAVSSLCGSGQLGLVIGSRLGAHRCEQSPRLS